MDLLDTTIVKEVEINRTIQVILKNSLIPLKLDLRNIIWIKKSKAIGIIILTMNTNKSSDNLKTGVGIKATVREVMEVAVAVDMEAIMTDTIVIGTTKIGIMKGIRNLSRKSLRLTN